MRKNNFRFGRRKALSIGVAGMGSMLVPSAVTADSDRLSAESQSTSSAGGPMNLSLIYGDLTTDTSNFSQYNQTDYPDHDEHDYGGPDDISASNVQDAIDDLNRAASSGDIRMFQLMSNPPLPWVEFDNSGPVIMSSNSSSGCSTTNGFDWSRTTFTNEIEITLDDDTAGTVTTSLAAGAGTATIVGAITNATGIGSVPGWVSVAIGAVLGYWAADLAANTGDCGAEITITVPGVFPVPFADIEPVN